MSKCGIKYCNCKSHSCCDCKFSSQDNFHFPCNFCSQNTSSGTSHICNWESDT